MKHRKNLGAAICAVVALGGNSAQAENVYSVASLTLLCGDPVNHEMCSVYLHGVVEAWMLKDVISADPPKYLQGNGPQFCEAINEASGDKRVLLIRRNLKSMQPGFAADAVMRTLSKDLCR